MFDGGGGDFVVANEAGKDGQAGGVGAGPGVGALLVGEEIPDGAGARIPLRGLRIRTVEFVEKTIGAVEDENVAIAGAGIRVTLNGSGERDGHGTEIALGAIGGVVDGNEGLRGVDDGVGDTHRGTVIQTGAEIGMQANGIADEVEDVGRVGIDGRGRDVFVPEIVGRERKEAVEAGALPCGHAGANVIERSVIVCDTENFSVDESWLSRQPLAEPKTQVELSRKLAAQEKEMIEAALRESGGRVSGPSGAAAKLGIPGSTLDSKIRSLRINKNRFKTADPSTDRT